MIANRAAGSPKDGTGFPQYSQSANARRFTRAISRQCAINLGQRLHATIRACNSSRLFEDEGDFMAAV